MPVGPRRAAARSREPRAVAARSRARAWLVGARASRRSTCVRSRARPSGRSGAAPLRGRWCVERREERETRRSAAGAVGGAGADGVLVEALGEVQALEDELDAATRSRPATRRPRGRRAPARRLRAASSSVAVLGRRARPRRCARPSRPRTTRRSGRALGPHAGPEHLERSAAFMMRSSTWPSRPSSSVSISILPARRRRRARRGRRPAARPRAHRSRSARRVAFATSVS